MILIIWAILFIISIIFLILGYSFRETSISDVLIPISWIFIFFLGLGVTFEKLDITSGTSETTTYTYLADNSTINSTQTTTTKIYEPYKNEVGYWKFLGSRTFGFLLSIISIAGFMIFWIEFKHRGGDYETAW